MIYHLFEYLSNSGVDFPGIGLMQYITFRSLIALMTALLVALYAGPRIIRKLQKKQIGEEIRDLGLEGQMQKKGTPTMGGIIIIMSILIPALLFGNLTNIYVQLMIVSAIWLGLIGFLDDSIKVFRKNKDGLSGKYKIIGQVTLGLVVGIALCMSDQTNIDVTLTNIPFFKGNQFDYSWLSPFDGEFGEIFTRIIYVAVIIFIITAVSNGSNLTDGMDGLATGVSAFIGITLAILAYLSGNTIYASYLDIMYIPHSGEVVIFMSAFIGALVGFLWYNTYPAQVFMGDTGSLAFAAIILKKELLIPVMCGIFLVESLSVIMQRYYFKYTKKKYGEGHRIFKMSPLHHHFQKEGMPALIQKPEKAWPEAKIVVRFWIITILLCAITIITLKIR